MGALGAPPIVRRVQEKGKMVLCGGHNSLFGGNRWYAACGIRSHSPGVRARNCWEQSMALAANTIHAAFNLDGYAVQARETWDERP
jgi:hypothetical protein